MSVIYFYYVRISSFFPHIYLTVGNCNEILRIWLFFWCTLGWDLNLVQMVLRIENKLFHKVSVCCLSSRTLINKL